ncbi:hypothetical protein MKEN_00753000 [Mycena kentingensis (nom. inval.)]|nr:hypothetical protein MKEN_00753000 [Mycena kentingensis (nom. inval.)]
MEHRESSFHSSSDLKVWSVLKVNRALEELLGPRKVLAAFIHTRGMTEHHLNAYSRELSAQALSMTALVVVAALASSIGVGLLPVATQLSNTESFFTYSGLLLTIHGAFICSICLIRVRGLETETRRLGTAKRNIDAWIVDWDLVADVSPSVSELAQRMYAWITRATVLARRKDAALRQAFFVNSGPSLIIAGSGCFTIVYECRALSVLTGSSDRPNGNTLDFGWKDCSCGNSFPAGRRDYVCARPPRQAGKRVEVQ